MSFLNTVPLVWGMMHGPQAGLVDLSFSFPSECADRVARGEADLGILPVAEVQRLGLPYLPDVGIACTGAVRSILLISKIPLHEIRTLAADSSSRTSVMLARIVLARKYGSHPAVRTLPPRMDDMLAQCDSALIIGDPALRIDPNSLPYTVLDLGAEWFDMTGLPMIFALWSGPEQFMSERYRRAFVESCRFGLSHIEDIVKMDAPARGFPAEVVRTYLTKHIQFELGAEHLEGLDLFLKYIRDMEG